MPSDAQEFGPFFHGTKADLQPGDLLEPGCGSNFGERMRANYIYLTANLDAATWGAELAVGEGPGRIYRVEPTGPFEDDPNLTDKRFPGNPTRSYRTWEPLRVVGEVLDWAPHSPEVLQDMRDHLQELKRLGIGVVSDSSRVELEPRGVLAPPFAEVRHAFEPFAGLGELEHSVVVVDLVSGVLCCSSIHCCPIKSSRDSGAMNPSSDIDTLKNTFPAISPPLPSERSR